MRNLGGMNAALIACSLLGSPAAPPPNQIGDLPMSGEVTATSVIVQTQVHAGGTGHFEVTDVLERGPSGVKAWTGESVAAKAEHGGVVRTRFTGLTPNKGYEFQWVPDDGEPGHAGTFRTLPAPDADTPVNFVVVTGLNYAKFHGSGAIDRKQHLEQNNTELPPPAPEGERALGYPMLEAIKTLAPRFVVFTGDTVYYDTPKQGRATTREEMRGQVAPAVLTAAVPRSAGERSQSSHEGRSRLPRGRLRPHRRLRPLA